MPRTTDMMMVGIYKLLSCKFSMDVELISSYHSAPN